MQSRVCLVILSGLVAFLNSATPALAWLGLGKFTMTDGSGDQVVVKHGLFGRKTVVTDRFGNGVETSRSIFGLTKDTKVGVLGNEVHSHKGLFGFSKTESQSMLGDTVTSNKNPLYGNTNINLKGVDGLLSGYMQPKQANLPMAAPIPPYQSQSYNAPSSSPEPLTSSPSPTGLAPALP
jgi:hypothetical protein